MVAGRGWKQRTSPKSLRRVLPALALVPRAVGMRAYLSQVARNLVRDRGADAGFRGPHTTKWLIIRLKDPD